MESEINMFYLVGIFLQPRQALYLEPVDSGEGCLYEDGAI